MKFELPYNLTLLPGIKQDARGNLYRMGRYPSGKLVDVPYTEDGNAEPARMIPEPKEPLRMNGKKHHTISTSKGKAPFKPFQPQRLHVVEVRWKGQKHISKAVAPNNQNTVAVELLPFSRFDGKEWHPLEPVSNDWHVQYHIDEKEPDNG